jgi:excisionase family DNA binding protein
LVRKAITPNKAQDRSPLPKKPFAERQNGKLLTDQETADILGVKKRMVWRLHHRHELRGIPVGGLMRWHIDDINAYIEKQRGQSARPRKSAA